MELDLSKVLGQFLDTARLSHSSERVFMNSMLKGKQVSFKDEEFRTAQNSDAGCTTGGTFDCVAVAMKDGVVAVRSSYDNAKVTALFTADEWACFVHGVKAGQFDI